MPTKNNLSSDLKLRFVNKVMSGHDYGEAETLKEVLKSTVQSIITKFKRTNTVEAAPKSGRTRKMSPKLERNIAIGLSRRALVYCARNLL